jgi:hypothetical protein
MNNPSVLFSSSTRNVPNIRGNMELRSRSELGGNTFPAPNGIESSGNARGGAANEYRLPSGIASLEHWLDLNA